MKTAPAKSVCLSKKTSDRKFNFCHLSKIYVFLLFSFFSFSLHLKTYAQTPPLIEWDKRFGGSLDDKMIIAIQTSDGGFILGGTSYSGISGDKTEASRGSADYWVIKTDASGNKEWDKTFGGTSNDYFSNIIESNDGGYVICGSSESGIGGDKSEASRGGMDIWIVKIDETGLKQWDRRFGGSSTEYGAAIIQIADDGYIIGGRSASLISGDVTQTSRGGDDFWLLKITSEGAKLWDVRFGGSLNEVLSTRGLIPTIEGGFVLFGYSPSGISGDKTQSSWGGNDYWMVKINAAGIKEWDKRFGGTGIDYGVSIQQSADSGFIMGGISYSNISGDKTESHRGNGDYWIIKIDSLGIKQWDKRFGGFNNDLHAFTGQTLDGGYITAGFSFSPISEDKSEGVIGGYDCWLVRTDAAGIKLWDKVYGGVSPEEIYGLRITPEGAFIIAGTTESDISGDVSEVSRGGYDFWYFKTEPEAVVTTYYADADGDSFGDPTVSILAILPPLGYVVNNLDCDDSNSSIYPGTDEICNGLDDNCDVSIDEGIIVTSSTTALGPTTFCQGSTVILQVTHNGTSLQWKKDGLNIPGATGTTYTASTNGSYTCTATSICGSATSMSIIVVVNKNPKAIITAVGPTTFCAGGSVTLKVQIVAGATYQWYKGPVLIPGATGSNYVATTSGNYRCRVTKTASGCFKNSNTIAVSVPCRETDSTFESDSTILKIYPNPCRTNFTLNTQISTTENQATLVIYDAIGAVVYEEIVNIKNGVIETNIALNSNIPSGIFIIRLVLEGKSYTNQLVLQN